MIQAVYSDKRNFSKHEARHDIRVGERLPVNWSLKGKEINGTGRVCNISASGMMVEARTDILPDKDCVLEFQAFLQGQSNLFPLAGRLVWSRSRGLLPRRSLWGVEFVDPQPEVIDRLHNRIQQKVENMISVQKILNVFGWILLALMTVLAAGILIVQAVNYNNLVSASNMLLASSAQQAVLYKEVQDQYVMLKGEYLQVSKELEETRVILSQLQLENGNLTQEMKAVKIRLKRDNQKLTQQLREVKAKLDLYEGNVNNMDQAQLALSMNRSGLRSIKTSLRQIKHQAHLAKVEAQQERDRILLSLGNRGLVIKEGKPFQPDFPAPNEPIPLKKVRIDVEMVD